MRHEAPHTAPAAWPEIRPGRFARTIRVDSPEGRRVALLGLPDDTGVGLNNGRKGAKGGPGALRAALASFGTDYDGAAERPLTARVFDAGNVVPSEKTDPVEAMRETHERVTEAVASLHGAGLLPVCVGGGHDLTFAAVRALSQCAGGPVGGVNFDAHLDVRDAPGSGMPFRALIDGGFLDGRRYAVLGAGRYANAREHVEWAVERGATIIDVEVALRHEGAIKEAFAGTARGEAPDAPRFVTIDLDGIDASQAPGVSAPNPLGLTVRHACAVARRAGQTASVRHFDVMELSPPHDDGGRTARVAALVFLSFIAGLEDRWA